MSRISERDRYELALLRGAGFLREVSTPKLNLDNGAIAVFCADGDQMFDIYTHLAKICKGKWLLLHNLIRFSPVFLRRVLKIDEVFSKFCKIFPGLTPPRIHLLTTNGGAIRLSGLWPDKEASRILLNDIVVASELKGINTVLLYVHAPCGAATLHNLEIVSVIDRLMDAKAVVKRAGNFKVACFVHVDWGNGRGKRTYFISANAWRAFRKFRG